MELNSNKEEAKKRLISAYVEYRSLRGKKARSKYLDNLQKRFKYNRKALIRMLSKAPEKQVRSVGASIGQNVVTEAHFTHGQNVVTVGVLRGYTPTLEDSKSALPEPR